MDKKQSGFTLIEILVVVSILAVLMSLVVILVQRAPKKQREMQATTLVTNLALSVESFQGEFRRYPPMTVKGIVEAAQQWKGLAIENSTNEGSECLAVALNHPDFTKKLGDDFSLGNTDGDIFNQVVPGTNSPDAREIVDPWGNPVVYIEKNHYETPVEIVLANGDHATVQAYKKKDGTYYNPTKFQLICLGENGKQDADSTGDDIVNFKWEND